MAQQSNRMLTPEVVAPDVVRTRNGAGDTRKTAFSDMVSEALRRGIMAKFFATLGGEAQLRSDLRMVCLEAKHNHIRVEHLIIALKDAWRGLPEARTLPQGTQGPELLNRMITLCIAEFYAPRAD